MANLLDIVPVRDEQEQYVVLKAVNYYGDGMTPFDAFHAATAETRRLNTLSAETNYGDTAVTRTPIEPTGKE